MLLNISQLIILFCLFLWAASKLTENRIIFYSVVTAFAFLLTLEASSVYLINKPFGYQYWINVNFEDIQVYLFQFYRELAYSGIFLALTFALITYLSKKVGSNRDTHWTKYQLALPIACVALLSLPNGVFHSLSDLVRIQFVEEGSVEQALTAMGINSGDYVFPDELKAVSGKNIVVISMESLEKGFLNPAYGEVAPGLIGLGREYGIQKLLAEPRSAWTSGSLYTVLTGIIPVFQSSNNGNFLFDEIEELNFSTLGKVLSLAGYQMKYLMSDVKFSGTEKLLRVNNFDVVTNEANKNLGYFKTPNDLDLFREAKKQVGILSESKKPFALFLSTVNSHFPKGLYDPRMEFFIKKKKSDFKNEIDFSVMSTDYLVSDFIKFLDQEGVLQNTVFFIYPDHQMMGQGSHILKLNQLGRELYFITNAKKTSLNNALSGEQSQLNLARIIVDGSEIRSNIKFLSDFKNLDLSNQGLARLNTAIVRKNDLNKEFRINFDEKHAYLIQENRDSVEISNVNKNTKWLNLVFDQGMVLKKVFSGDGNFSPYRDVTNLKSPLQLTIFLNKLHPYSYYFGNYISIGTYEIINSKNKYFNIQKTIIEDISKKNKIAFSNLIHEEQSALSNSIITSYKSGDVLGGPPKLIQVVSSEYITAVAGNPSKIILDNQSFPVSRGLNIFYINNNLPTITTFDVHADMDSTTAMMRLLKKLVNERVPFLIFAHDSIGNNLVTHEEELRKIGLIKLTSLNNRVAYIGFFDGSSAKEESDPTTISRSFSILEKYKQWIPPKAIPIKKYVSDKSRFIAHAGGQIDGKKYTNSLEALDYSYAKGLRLFELDIITTSDGYYVAAHDWKTWASMTAYSGVLPPSKDVFLEKKIYGKFTPLDLARINDWFRVHKDAILITDKLNEPRKFSTLFVDKRRLKMELFTIEAVQEGIASEILAPMPTDNLWPEIYKKYMHLVKSGNIKYIAASRNINRVDLQQILDAGLKIYAFNVNDDEIKNEEWVICNERNIFYGIYLDNQSLLGKNNCPVNQ
jgi:hypothetical protein